MHTDALDEAFHLLAYGGCLTDVLAHLYLRPQCQCLFYDVCPLLSATPMHLALACCLTKQQMHIACEMRQAS